ncbi:helix-turn-helix domain-containing protein [Dehalogenimonas sp. THU2]|uniref:helix-turn-helix domain-containing protein n=1 Tax=Dehalogenimonas sp. THU2 TaxID=3151121 RepID=UPI0032184D7C
MKDSSVQKHSSLTKVQQGKRLCLTVPEAAEMLGISRNHAYELVRQNQLPSVKLGNRIVIPKIRLEKFLEGGGA